ncbi:conserved hypothetical protein [Rhodospirillaceae bacterium LM-1]|nr:conserved hypothetical protein [Rhodospirillaceae bacterium LM-1]
MKFPEDLTLVRAVLAGDRQALERLLRRVAKPVWSACRLLTQDEEESQSAFIAVEEALCADGFRRLRPYNGSSRIETFVVLIARDVLAARLLQFFQTDATGKGWSAFERFFEADIRRILARRLPGGDHEDRRQDAYQEICLALVTDNFRRLKAYSGMGSFTGFVVQMVDRLLIDFIRRTSSRRRLPTAILRLGSLDQAIFRYVYWDKVSLSSEALLAAVGRDFNPRPAMAEVNEALERVRKALPPGFDPASGSRAQTISLSECEEMPAGSEEHPSPEQAFLSKEAEKLLSIAATVLRETTETLSEAERLYVRIALSGEGQMPARDVARMMQRPVEEVYKLKQRVMGQLREKLEGHSAVRDWLASV